MQPHTKLYIKFYGYGQEQEYVPCEICGRPCVDIHHIDARGMGGSGERDFIENLFGLCREHHDRCEDGTITLQRQYELHFAFIASEKPLYVINYSITKYERESIEESPATGGGEA